MDSFPPVISSDRKNCHPDAQDALLRSLSRRDLLFLSASGLNEFCRLRLAAVGNLPLQCEAGCTVSGNHLLAAT